MARDGELIKRAKAMRAVPSPAEGKLWRLLCANRTISAKFSRQVVIGRYIADFAARSAKLVIELDGDGHDLQVDYDARRTADLQARGYRVIRFRNKDVMRNAEGVLHVIREALACSPLPSAACGGFLPLPARGERVDAECRHSGGPPSLPPRGRTAR